MRKKNEIVSRYYNENTDAEWKRLDEHPLEYIFTVKMMERHIRSGERVLDIGGGPGRYSLHFAAMGCDVTLLDLSEREVAFAAEKAEKEGQKIRTVCCDCTDEYLAGEVFDHVFLMGPLYHLQDDRMQREAVIRAMEHLKDGGLLYCSFLTNLAGVIHDLKYGPGYWMQEKSKQNCRELMDAILYDTDYKGKSFTKCRFMSPRSIKSFMSQFELEQVHFFGQKSIFSFNELQMRDFPEKERELWIETGEKLMEVPEVVGASEAVMYIGRKTRVRNYPFKGIVFDLDGTILESTGIWGQIDEDFFGRRGMKVPEEYNASIAGMSIEECAVYTKERWNLEESTEDIIEEWNEGVRRQYLEKIGLKPGAKEYLQMLKKRGVILGVATALSTELLVPCLKRLQVYSLFDAVVSVDQVDCGGKKTAAVYTRAMGQMGIKPEECVIFEDTLAGIEEAKRTGARVYCMSDEVSRRLQPEIEKRSDSLFENFFELLPGQRELLPDGEEKAFAAGIRACGLRAVDEKNELSD